MQDIFLVETQRFAPWWGFLSGIALYGLMRHDWIFVEGADQIEVIKKLHSMTNLNNETDPNLQKLENEVMRNGKYLSNFLWVFYLRRIIIVQICLWKEKVNRIYSFLLNFWIKRLFKGRHNVFYSAYISTFRQFSVRLQSRIKLSCIYKDGKIMKILRNTKTNKQLTILR